MSSDVFFVVGLRVVADDGVHLGVHLGCICMGGGCDILSGTSCESWALLTDLLAIMAGRPSG
jgi:hypothetical protein